MLRLRVRTGFPAIHLDPPRRQTSAATLRTKDSFIKTLFLCAAREKLTYRTQLLTSLVSAACQSLLAYFVLGLPSAVWEPNRAETLTAEQRPDRGEEGHLERQLVLAFTAEGGIRNKPTRQELEELVARSRSLNCHSLASELVGQLEPRAVGSKLVSSYF